MGAFVMLFLLATATTAASASFDFWKLALQWPPTAAIGYRRPYIPGPPRFTIHGLWHDHFNSSVCICPAPQHSFNYSLLYNARLISRLSFCWPDVQRGNNAEFWKHEWDAHGGCSEWRRYDQVGHFRMGVDLYNRFNILAALTQASVNPSSPNSVLLATINSSIINVTTKVPILTCSRISNRNGNIREILQEVHLCFDYYVPHHPVTDCPPPPRCNNPCRGPDIFFM